MGEALPKYGHGNIKENASGALSSGEVGQHSDGRANYVEGLSAIASGDEVSLRHAAVVDIAKASATTFSKGDPVYWDASANQAVSPAATLDGSTDFYLGVCAKDAANGDSTVRVDLNVVPFLPMMPQTFVREFDCEDGEDETGGTKNTWQLVPAEVNKRGLLILAIFARVTEQFGGGTEDQGVVTIRDESNNSLATITVADAGADAVGDFRLGYNMFAATAGDALQTVAAGEYIDGQVTQETSGAAAAGKVQVYVLAVPLV